MVCLCISCWEKEDESGTSARRSMQRISTKKRSVFSVGNFWLVRARVSCVLESVPALPRAVVACTGGSGSLYRASLFSFSIPQSQNCSRGDQGFTLSRSVRDVGFFSAHIERCFARQSQKTNTDTFLGRFGG